MREELNKPLRIKQYPDGTVVTVDSMTEKKKKNRHRHVKDGAPKHMRGIQNKVEEIVYEPDETDERTISQRPR